MNKRTDNGAVEPAAPGAKKEAKGDLHGVFGAGFKGAVEKLVTFILFGAVMATGGYLYKQFQTIEDSITRHHGPGWEDRIEALVSVDELRDDLEQLQRNTKRLALLNQELDEAQRVFGNWGRQLDALKEKEAGRQVGGYAEINLTLPSDVNLCTVNRAHPHGYRYDLGNEIRLSYAAAEGDSMLSCTVSSLMESHENTNVIVQVNDRMARQMDLYARGRLKVVVGLPQAQPGDEFYWEPLPPREE